MMEEGSVLEISYENDGSENVWYEAIIDAAKPERRVGDRCVRLLKDDIKECSNRKRKRDLCSAAAIVEENEAEDITTMVLPFEKKSPFWKKIESMDIFKIFPQSPHFCPLLEVREDTRELFAVGRMLTFAALLELVKDLQPEDPISSLTSLNHAFSELKKHGFDVTVPELRISKLLSLRDRQAKIMEELKGAEKVTAEKESKKVENKLQMLNEEVDKEIAESKSCEAMIVHQLEDVRLQYHATASAPW